MQKFVRMVLGLFASLGVFLSLGACQLGQTACNVSVAEIIVIRGINYLPGNDVPDYRLTGTTITPAELGPVFDTINATIGGCTPPPQGNFSSFLPVGTKLYTIKGYQPSFRLAVKQPTPGQNQPISLLEAVKNPHATNGSEVMQLDHKVMSILLYSRNGSVSLTTPPLATVRAPQQVAKLVALFDQAPVNTSGDTGSMSDLLVFRFNDNTLSSLLYDPATGWTSRNVILPSTFASLLMSKST